MEYEKPDRVTEHKVQKKAPQPKIPGVSRPEQWYQ